MIQNDQFMPENGDDITYSNVINLLAVSRNVLYSFVIKGATSPVRMPYEGVMTTAL